MYTFRWKNQIIVSSIWSFCSLWNKKSCTLAAFLLLLFKLLLNSFSYRTCSYTSGTYIFPDYPVVFKYTDFLNVRMPDFTCPFIRMAYASSKLNGFSAYFTLCHDLILEFVIWRQLIIIRIYFQVNNEK